MPSLCVRIAIHHARYRFGIAAGERGWAVAGGLPSWADHFITPNCPTCFVESFRSCMRSLEVPGNRPKPPCRHDQERLVRIGARSSASSPETGNCYRGASPRGRCGTCASAGGFHLAASRIHRPRGPASGMNAGGSAFLVKAAIVQPHLHSALRLVTSAPPQRGKRKMRRFRHGTPKPLVVQIEARGGGGGGSRLDFSRPGSALRDGTGALALPESMTRWIMRFRSRITIR